MSQFENATGDYYWDENVEGDGNNQPPLNADLNTVMHYPQDYQNVGIEYQDADNFYPHYAIGDYDMSENDEQEDGNNQLPLNDDLDTYQIMDLDTYQIIGYQQDNQNFGFEYQNTYNFYPHYTQWSNPINFYYHNNYCWYCIYNGKAEL